MTATAPLLSEAEIRELVRSATNRPPAGPRQRPPQQGRSGEQQATVTGAGSDFAETRPYQAGDDPRRIDWRATARSRAPLLRSYHTELSQPLYLVVDRGASMRFATRRRLKVTQGVRCALSLAATALAQGREVASVLLDHPCHWLPEQRGTQALETFIDLANRPCPPIAPAAHDPSWERLLASLRQRIPGGAELVLLSDFNDPGIMQSRILGALGQHCAAQALIISDPAEKQLSRLQGLQLSWGRRQLLPGHQRLTELAHQQAHWREALLRQLRRAGFDYRELSTEVDDLTFLGGMIR